MAKSRIRARSPKKVLRIPDLEHSKHAVINSLPARASQECYEYAIDEFISWYCSEPRLAFNRTVVLRYRFFLEQRNLAPSTINVRLAAVRRLAYEAADSGLLSPELAAGIAGVKGAKRFLPGNPPRYRQEQSGLSRGQLGRPPVARHAGRGRAY